MEEMYKIAVKNSEMYMEKDRRILLTFKRDYCMDCIIEETDDESIFCFDLSNMRFLNDLERLSLKDKYRLLINMADMYSLKDVYDCNISPDNVVYDINLIPKLLLRDKRRNEDSDFLIRYKAIIASVLSDKYSFEDYYKGGENLYKKHKKLKDLQSISEIAELKNWLMEFYIEEEEHIYSNTINIRRSIYKAIKLAFPLMGILCIAAMLYAANLYFNDFIYKDKLIKSHQYYLASDYVRLTSTLSDVDIEKLPRESKYILSRAYVSLEGLNATQKDNVLSGLSLSIDTHVYDFWILLGRADFKGAIDMAKRLGDTEMLVFTYIKELNYLKTDINISGEEKSKRIEELNKLIEEIKKNTSVNSGDNE